ncbi:putative vacuolar protein sorting-associated protein [Plasmopara halstedii]
MLDLLSPVRGYIAQNLQFYLSKYIEDIQLEGLGLFGGDLVLNDLEIKRHVLRESLEIPSSFDFSRGFIRELRIHIPWTQLLSQSIEVKLYTIELILTARSSTAGATLGDAVTDKATEIDQPKSGWIHDTLQKILSNVSLQVNNLVLKYEYDDIVFSIALGTLDFYSASENDGWNRSFEELKGSRPVICKRIDAKDVTIFLDRYINDEGTNQCTRQYPLRRMVAGYEVPVLSRASASVRAKVQLPHNAAETGKRDPTISISASFNQHHPSASDSRDARDIFDVDGLLIYNPSVLCDPFYYYLCNRSSVIPIYEVDLFVVELLFSASDRQLEMLNQLIQSANHRFDQAHKPVISAKCDAYPPGNTNKVLDVHDARSEFSQLIQADDQVGIVPKNKESWFGWAINALGSVENGQEDALESELLAETREALLERQPSLENENDGGLFAACGSGTRTSCVRMCVGSVSLTLRKHAKEGETEYQDAAGVESREELVPVANLGMVKISSHPKRKKVARPALPVLHLSLSFVTIEMLLARGQEQSGTDLVFEIEKVRVSSALDDTDGKDMNGEMLMTWGLVDATSLCDCVSHPYFISTFFKKEIARLNQLDRRRFDIVKVAPGIDIPVWMTLRDGRINSEESSSSPCKCSSTWNGESVRCISTSAIFSICQDAINKIGIKERVLDDGILFNAVSAAWTSSEFPSIATEGMTRALTAAASEYRAHRKSDLPALDNLVQLLLPQLFALCCRFSGHSCPSAILHPASNYISIRHRSDHSALRMRSASTSKILEHDAPSPENRIEDKAVTKILDVSIGAAHAVLEPLKCLATLEVLSIFLHKNEVDVSRSATRPVETSMSSRMNEALTKKMAPELKTKMLSDIALITGSRVSVHIPNPRPNAGNSSNHCSGLNVIGSDFMWQRNYFPGDHRKRLQLGAVTVQLGDAQSEFTHLPLVEALGFELEITESFADGDSNDELFASLVKAKIDLTSFSLHNFATVISDFVRPLGFDIAWVPTILASKQFQEYYQIEACLTNFSQSVVDRPRVVTAQRQSLRGRIASLTITSRKKPTSEMTVIFQGGAAPKMLSKTGISIPLFKFDMLYEKSAGKLDGVPLLSLLKTFTRKPDFVSTVCAHCRLGVCAHLAYVYLDAQGGTQLIGAVLHWIKDFSAALVGNTDLKPETRHVKDDTLDGNTASSISTGWSFIIDWEAGGSDVRVNEALQLRLSQVSLLSIEKEADSLNPVKPGGILNLKFTAKGATLFASDSGCLKDIQNPIILSIENIRTTVKFSHEFIDYQHDYAFEVMFHAACVQASLSRLKLLYILKIPNIMFALLREVATHDASHPPKLNEYERDNDAIMRVRWFYTLRAQLDHFDVSCAADIDHRSNHKKERIRAVINGNVSNINVAARISNHHPIKKHLYLPTRGKFTDIQVSVGKIQVIERLFHAWKNSCIPLGNFSRLPANAFLGILVCLNVRDLKSLSETLHAIDTNMHSNEELLPPAMLSWHLASSIAKSIQAIKAKWHKNQTDRTHFFAEIPLIVAYNESALKNDPLSFPMFSGFYRNYSEAGLPLQVVAGSMESLDLVMTTSSFDCLASVVNVRGKKVSAVDNIEFPTVKTQTTHNLEVSLANIEISLLLGQVRLISPDENLIKFVQCKQQVDTQNVVVVLESMSIVSAVHNEISLDGLGYPLFNSRILPRRLTVHAQRFGQSQLRIECKTGKIYGFVADLSFSSGLEPPPEWKFSPRLNEVATFSNIFGHVGPFEEYFSTLAGHSAHFTSAERFWSPLNITCSAEEEFSTKNEGNGNEAKIAISIAITKLHLQLNKHLFDILYSRIATLYRGIQHLKRSIAFSSPVKLTPIHSERLCESSLEFTSTKEREFTFSSDGIEIDVIEMDNSSHFRVGSILLLHNTLSLSGSASIKTLVVGHRIFGNETDTVAIEEVVFGAKAEPSLWQRAVENYPEKLVAAKWNYADRSQRTIFVDVQACQLHVSHHFIQALAQFLCTNANIPSLEQKVNECCVQAVERKPFVIRQRWNVKLLVAPSVMSYWRQQSIDGRKSGVWMTSGQLFASIEIGSDEATQQSFSSCSTDVNEINRFIVAPSLKMMMNLDKFGLNISDDLPPLIVIFQKNSSSPITNPTSSTWPQFVKYISIVSEAQRFLYDCSIRVTGDEHQVLEQIATANHIFWLYTGVSKTNIQAEVTALCIQISSYSLDAIRSLLSASENKGSDVPTKKLFDQKSVKEDAMCRKSFDPPDCREISADDFKYLKRMAESRRPLPGELVFTEALSIETHSIVPDDPPSVMAHIQIEPNKFDIAEADVVAYLENCNKLWKTDYNAGEEQSSSPGHSNRTHCWMGMRWCYHIPRKICKIVADPVPILPSGLPSAWPSWNWKHGQNDSTSRFCDILCQLRCWDHQKSIYIVVGEFCVPWEQILPSVSPDNSNDANELGSFGDLMNHWFDDSVEEILLQTKLLEFGARTRTYLFDSDIPSDNWEIRWRSPLQSEHDPENKQMRLLVNALLASSLQIHSMLIWDAYQRVESYITFPQTSMSISLVGPEKSSHDIITAEFNDTNIACLVFGSTYMKTMTIRVSSGLQVYLNNVVQLLTVSVISRTSIDILVEMSNKGLKISTLVGPISLYLNQTSILVLCAIPRLLHAETQPIQTLTANPNEKLSSMRINIVNYTGVDIWYRQNETSECLHLPAEASAAYSWLSLASSSYYQLCFAVDDPIQKRGEVYAGGKKDVEKLLSEKDDFFWCDPCRIKENCVTGRYFSGRGFVWVCVELSGLQTKVSLYSSLIVCNYCNFPVRVKVSQTAIYNCTKSEYPYKRGFAIRKHAAHNHPHCVSLDGSVCTLLTSQVDGSIARIMVESVSTISFAVNGGSWCDMETQQTIPSEFDHVKADDLEAKGHFQFKSFNSESLDEPIQYVWVKVARAKCRTVLPIDFDHLQPQIAGRYTWVEVSIYPAIIVQNIIDAPAILSFSQKNTSFRLELFPACEKCISTINPFEPVKILLQYGQDLSKANTYSKLLELNMQFTSAGKSKEQIFDFEDCRVVVSYCDDRKPMVRIRLERVLSIANKTPSDLMIWLATSFEDQNRTLHKVESCGERSIGFTMTSDCLIIAIASSATTAGPRSGSNQMSWSSEISLDGKGDTKPIVLPAMQAGSSNLASAFCVELLNSEGYLKLTILPLVVVINATKRDIVCVPTDGRGNALGGNDETSLVSGDNAGWCVPVCLHREAKKRSITADVSSWLSSKLSRRTSDVEPIVDKQHLMARLSCSFRVRLVEDEYEWTEEITVLLPNLHVGVNSDGRLIHFESFTPLADTLKDLYPSPSTTTYRRRLLVRHCSFKHKMLTYTTTQSGKSIHVMFFVDHQPPVIIHNHWQKVLAFRNVSVASDPEGVGANFCLEYDWSLQVPTKNCTQAIIDDKLDAECKLLANWLKTSSQSFGNTDTTDLNPNEHTRFQIGSPQYGWSNVLWQTGGIQFASFNNDEDCGTITNRLTFLVMNFYRAGSWLISITCVEDPTGDGLTKSLPSLVQPSAADSWRARQITSSIFKIGVIVDEISLHLCDEHDPKRDARGLFLYPEILRTTCSAVSIVFATAPDPPETLRHNTRLGYMSHIRSYMTLFAAIERIEVGHFLQACNFPVIFWFYEPEAKRPLLQSDKVKQHQSLECLINKLLDKRLPEAENPCLTIRIIYADTINPTKLLPYFNCIEVKVSPAFLQVEDKLLMCLIAFVQPICAALEGYAVCQAIRDIESQTIATRDENTWSSYAYETIITKQRKVYIEYLGISDLQVTITARVSVPVLNSFDGTPLHFGYKEMREVFTFPDQLYKDLAADYVADTIVRSPLLLMSLNIFGNPAGFIRSFGQGVRDLIEIPLAASRNGYSPWILTKGLLDGIASFLGHTTAATLSSVSGFSYSISRTVDHITLPSDQLRKRHYKRPTKLTSALADGLGSLGSSVVGAAAGVVTTPMAVYRDSRMRGVTPGFGNVVGSVGMGLVGIVARPMGGVASLVSMASDGLLVKLEGSRIPFDESTSRFDGRPNELLRYKLKVLFDATGGYLVFAHGLWINPEGNTLIIPDQGLIYFSREQLGMLENEPLCGLLLPRDANRQLVEMTVVCSNECIYVVGMTTAQNQAVLARTSLKSIEAVEESLKEPTVFDLGIKTSEGAAEWLRFRLPPPQRRHLSHQLRLWLAEPSIKNP